MPNSLTAAVATVLVASEDGSRRDDGRGKVSTGGTTLVLAFRRHGSVILAIGVLGVLAAARPAAAAGLAEFGRCLASRGAIFYGASWCPHCRSQRQILGEALSGVRYVECSVDGGRGASVPACTSARVDSFPTWVFADGTRAQGVQSLAGLAARTGCALPSGSGRSGASTGGKPDDSGRPSGPKIIEVPH